MSDLKLSIVFEAVNRMGAPLRAMEASLGNLRQAHDNLQVAVAPLAAAQQKLGLTTQGTATAAHGAAQGLAEEATGVQRLQAAVAPLAAAQQKLNAATQGTAAVTQKLSLTFTPLSAQLQQNTARMRPSPNREWRRSNRSSVWRMPSPRWMPP